MAKDFSFSVTIDHPVAEVHRAFITPELWQRRVEGAENVTMTTESPGPGTIEVTVTQNIPSESLPAIVRKALRGDLSIVRTDNWGPLEGDQAGAKFTAQSTGLTSSTEGTLVLRADGARATLDVEGRTEVKARFIGGAIEPMIVQMVTKLVKSECDDTATWISERAEQA
ncbi:DUF2505 domain-containing protein [Hoyosella altamirensis]|uniref:Uncharacterized protein YndB with AHSA1/START domain n=1 Tax=Hoyosella altamirensis TaxID=616997 RepID=A0A839RLH0_9ACTN|nr:DUF2505 domain-containing protein [Hoyosella altamirensis]MBB3036903.1 uncharacterized protein YndB with AHSA1/START domain [Hoyosella altamirensis]